MNMSEVEFPTSEEAKKILLEESIDTGPLKERVIEMLCTQLGHKWEMSWPLDPCEYTCSRCGVKQLH
jgi:hypothetical protein